MAITEYNRANRARTPGVQCRQLPFHRTPYTEPAPPPLPPPPPSRPPCAPFHTAGTNRSPSSILLSHLIFFKEKKEEALLCHGLATLPLPAGLAPREALSLVPPLGPWSLAWDEYFVGILLYALEQLPARCATRRHTVGDSSCLCSPPGIHPIHLVGPTKPKRRSTFSHLKGGKR